MKFYTTIYMKCLARRREIILCKLKAVEIGLLRQRFLSKDARTFGKDLTEEFQAIQELR